MILRFFNIEGKTSAEDVKDADSDLEWACVPHMRPVLPILDWLKQETPVSSHGKSDLAISLTWELFLVWP